MTFLCCDLCGFSKNCCRWKSFCWPSFSFLCNECARNWGINAILLKNQQALLEFNYLMEFFLSGEKCIFSCILKKSNIISWKFSLLKSKVVSLRRITHLVWWIIFFNTCMHGEKTSVQCSLSAVRFSESYILLLYNSSDHLVLSSLPHCKNYPQKHRKQGISKFRKTRHFNTFHIRSESSLSCNASHKA